MHDDHKYKEAIELYKQIPRSDTNYSKALYDLSASSYADSNFIASKQYAELGLKLFPAELDDWYSLLANALDDMGDKEKALACYDTILKYAPYAYVSWFNKGITLYNLNKVKEAKTYFQKTLLINPFYTSAHYFLGKIYVSEGNLPAAMLCYATGLAINPDNRYRDKTVTALSNIANVKDDVATAAAAAKPSKIDNFDMQQEILLGKIALDKQYKLKTDLEDAITRQMQVLFEKLEYDKNDNSFCMQFYVPLYKKIFEGDRFNTLVNFMFSGLTIKSVKEYNKKHKKEVDDYKQFALDYLNGIQETEVLNAGARDAAATRYYFSDGVFSGKGAWKIDNGNKIFYGPWEFYYGNGQLRSKGVLTENVKKQGEWVYYYNTGQMKEHSFYAADSLDGKSTSWFDNGNISEEVVYKDNKYEGQKTTYFYNGLPHEIIFYSAGKKTGIAKGYRSTGEFSYAVSFKDDLQDGPETYYYTNGKTLSEAVYVNGKADGPYKKYDGNGVLIMQGAYQQDKPVGTWKTWYSSSKLKQEYTYLDGEINGAYKEYFENGQVSQDITYINGKLDGKQVYNDEDGKLFCEMYYEKGLLRELKYYNKSGNLVNNTTTRRGAATLTFFDVYGNKISEGNFTKDGSQDGPGTAFFEDGKINSTETYSKGLLNGLKTIYFNNGVESEKINYKADKEDGYYTSFYENNKPRYEGWFVDGEKQGEHRNYNILGNAISIAWYRNDLENGYAEYYYPNGKKDYEELFDEGWIKHITQFDSTGKVMEDLDVPRGSCDFNLKYNNGKTHIKGSYRNYQLHGLYTAWYLDGTTQYVSYYNQGRRDSVYKDYFFGGKVQTEGRYKLGDKDGIWNYYYKNGKLNFTETFRDGELQSKSISYNDDGTKDKEYNYKDNAISGPYFIYGENNQVGVILNYNKGRLMSYSYEGKDGKLVAPVPLLKQSGPVTAYYKNGNKSVEMTFVNGAVEGARKFYFTNGKPYVDGVREAGYDQGPKKIYGTGGMLAREENNYYNNTHGVTKNYYPGGKIESEESWYNGVLNGVCRYYDETGKLKQTRFYYYGALESVQ